ncbi:MAG: TonB-dependent receptor [Pedobacter sp.]|nr:MAG: TonB-dependent receptor [Pedobacter sp.]
MRNKILFQGIAMLCFLSSALAQSVAISGRVTDQKGMPASFISLLVRKQADSTVVAGATSDQAGKFNITVPAAGSYYVQARGIGYVTWKSTVFTFTDNSLSRDLGNIMLTTDSRKLKEVEVVSSRPMIVQKEDRMVVGVEGSSIAAGNTAFQVLSNLPGVFVDANGNIQLNGKSGVTVMIDGKLTYLSARDLRTMLESMPGTNIKDVDIITNPSAKYDAEGSSGILNINLKKNIVSGINGSISAGINYNGKQTGGSTGLNINHKEGKFNSFLFADYTHRVSGRDATFTRIFYAPGKTTYFDQVATGNNLSTAPSFRFGTDLSMNKNHSISFITSILSQEGESDFLTNTDLSYIAGTKAQNIVANNYSGFKFDSFSTNLHYGGKLDTSGTILSADLDFVRIRNQSNANFYNYYKDLTGTGSNTQDFLLTDIPSGYDIVSAKIDFTKPISSESKLETGVKFSNVTSDNDSRFYFNNGPQPVLDPARTNHFIYKELIYAGYLNWRRQLGKKFSFQAGLRLEGTISDGNSVTINQVNKRNYVNLFPSLFLQQTVTSNYQLNYNYSRRIQRPNYRSLNPFIFYRDPYTYEQGNPGLQPQTTQSFGITQVFYKQYILTAQFQQLHNTMSEVPLLDVANATTVYTTGNIDDSFNFSLVASIPVKISKGWTTNNSLNTRYDKFTLVLGNGQSTTNKQLFVSATSNHYIRLPLKTNMELSMIARGPGASGLYLVQPSAWVNAGLKRSFLKDKLDLSLSVLDIFRTNRLYYKTNIAGNKNDFDQYFRNRAVYFTASYKFSKGSKTDAQRNTNLEELRRAGG